MTLDYTGEQVNTAVAVAKDMVIGTATVTITANTSVYEEVALDIGFDATETTRVIATLRTEASNPSPMFNICLAVRRRSKKMYAQLNNGAVNGATMPCLYAGTYYIDWLVISR